MTRGVLLENQNIIGSSDYRFGSSFSCAWWTRTPEPSVAELEITVAKMQAGVAIDVRPVDRRLAEGVSGPMSLEERHSVQLWRFIGDGREGDQLAVRSCDIRLRIRYNTQCSPNPSDFYCGSDFGVGTFLPLQYDMIHFSVHVR